MTIPIISPYAKRALAACGITAIVEAILVVSMTEPVLLLFALGPILFLAVIVWRRRTHPARSRRLAGVALGAGAFGIGAFAVAFLRLQTNPPPDQPSIAPLAVPLVQWIAVLFVWIAIARDESREQRANASPK